mmetsp:Transcript_6719/g.13116  ORF Transcript_6719/g.13116 Transcript_6719/m.13116 type:complete len:158 (+) Transcript_6719:2196-2669(+)
MSPPPDGERTRKEQYNVPVSGSASARLVPKREDLPYYNQVLLVDSHPPMSCWSRQPPGRETRGHRAKMLYFNMRLRAATSTCHAGTASSLSRSTGTNTTTPPDATRSFGQFGTCYEYVACFDTRLCPCLASAPLLCKICTAEVAGVPASQRGPVRYY